MTIQKNNTRANEKFNKEKEYTEEEPKGNFGTEEYNECTDEVNKSFNSRQRQPSRRKEQ